MNEREKTSATRVCGVVVMLGKRDEPLFFSTAMKFFFVYIYGNMFDGECFHSDRTTVKKEYKNKNSQPSLEDTE